MNDDIDMRCWQGRVDPEPDAWRWHQMVKPLTLSAPQGYALLGFASDAGVARNKGRSGARGAPTAIRRALANLAWFGDTPVYDAGDVVCGDDKLEQAQDAMGRRIAEVLAAGHFPIVLGGGHEVAFASWQGVARHLAAVQTSSKNAPTRGAPAKHATPEQTAPQIGIVNFDAHFDLRTSEGGGSSGTPFSQIADDCVARGWPFSYACLGVARTSNTQALFRRAAELGVLVHEDRDFDRAPASIAADLKAFIARNDYLYLTIDIDCLPSGEAPGVSAPAARGVSLAKLEPFIDLVRDSGKLLLADLAEFNPDYDLDRRTAKLAARLVHQYVGQT